MTRMYEPCEEKWMIVILEAIWYEGAGSETQAGSGMADTGRYREANC